MTGGIHCNQEQIMYYIVDSKKPFDQAATDLDAPSSATIRFTPKSALRGSA